MFSLKTLIMRLFFAAELGCASAVAQAQLGSLPEFIEKHLRAEAAETQGSPILRTRFDYNANGTLFTSHLAKFHNDGFDDRMALGMVRSFSNAYAKVSYNVHRFDYLGWESQASNVTFDLKYRTLLVQHRVDDSAAASMIALPLELGSAHLDLTYRKTNQHDSADTIDEYRFVSRFNRLKYSALWTNSAADTVVNLSTEFRPSGCCLMTYTYTTWGDDLQRRFRSEFSMTGFRLAGEYMSETTTGNNTNVSSAIVIEKDASFAALKLRFEHNEFVEAPTMFFNLESRVGF
jgi:hypothetical protein